MIAALPYWWYLFLSLKLNKGLESLSRGGGCCLLMILQSNCNPVIWLIYSKLAIQSTWNKIKGEVPSQWALIRNPVSQFGNLAIQSSWHNYAGNVQYCTLFWQCSDQFEQHCGLQANQRWSSLFDLQSCESIWRLGNQVKLARLHRKRTLLYLVLTMFRWIWAALQLASKSKVKFPSNWLWLAPWIL